MSAETGRHYGNHISAPVAATIVEHQLLGNIIRYTVQTAAGEMTVDLLNRSSERLFEPGSQLELLFNKNEIRSLA
ncbi:TOBE domain-containing protein [Moellerella wisconsensis]|uniref:TOBE domain-containing protein n=1 Tax=Moellerella wisconsensis TaxID=158849 RepID=UPI003AAFE37A